MAKNIIQVESGPNEFEFADLSESYECLESLSKEKERAAGIKMRENQ